MANITAMPFRSVDGDRPVSATMDARRFAQYVTNGIDNVSGTDALKVTPSLDGLSLVVAPGGAVINGYSGWLDSAETLTPSTPNANNPRIDRVIFRLNLNLDVRSFQLLLLVGTPAATPTPPSITRNDLVYDLVLADVLISAGSVIITDGSITDQRSDIDLCGHTGATISPENPITTIQYNYGAPTANTVGTIGSAYIDKSETPYAYYLCLGIDGDMYTWKRMGYMAKKLITEIITTSTTWTTPKNIVTDTDCRVMVFGGGGGGGTYGGGGGGYMNQFVGKLNNENYVVTIGSGGAGGTNGGTGGTTSFGVLVSASGGNGADSKGTGGNGGTGGGGVFYAGGDGTYGGGGGGGGYAAPGVTPGKGGNGGTFGGGGGGGATMSSGNYQNCGGSGGASVSYAGGTTTGKAGGGGAGYSGDGNATSTYVGGTGGNGKDTNFENGLDFVGSGNRGNGGAAYSSSLAGGGGGGGGYGGNGGAGGDADSTNAGGGGGGGGYGGNGGAGGRAGGGGGGGYGGNGKNGSEVYGGGGGGYGTANYGSGGNGNKNAGTAGVCIIQYYVYDLA